MWSLKHLSVLSRQWAMSKENIVMVKEEQHD
jgi:hypothetical protein